MVGQVHDGRFVGCRLILDIDRVVVREPVNHLDLQVAWESGLAVGREVGELDRLPVELACVPSDGMIAFRSAMQAMAIIVLGQLIALSVELELAVGDSVAIATDQGAIVIVRELDILLDVVVTQHDVCQFPVAVGYHDRYQAAAPVGDAGFGALAVFQYIQGGWFTVHLRYEVGWL